MPIHGGYVRTHHIFSHITNGVWPAGCIFLLLNMATGNASFEQAAFYCFALSLIATPLVYFSGVLDWKKRFEGRVSRIFNHKIAFGIIFMMISGIMVLWRFLDPQMTTMETGYQVYKTLAFINLSLVSYLGYLGGKFL